MTFDSCSSKVWPFLFSHYSFESTINERNDIDRKTIDHYNILRSEWQSAETIVTQIDLQHAASRKNSMKKPLDTNVQPVVNSAETALMSLRNVLASIPEKFALTMSTASDRKDSIASNEVFYEVFIIDTRFV
jgi:hypothetical protein